jgi:hypothetical protein
LSDHAIQFRFFQSALEDLGLDPLVEHRDDRTDNLEVAEFFGCDIEQHVLAASVELAEPLSKIAHRGRKFPVGTTELFEHQASEHGVRLRDAHGILQPLVVHKHRRVPVLAG